MSSCNKVTRRRKTQKHKKKYNIKYNIKNGGKAVDAGSYGCVFMPALKCKNNAIPYDRDKVSKLMYKKNATYEMKEYEKIKKIVQHIPNYDKYFLLSGVTQCDEPAPLQPADLENFDETCKLFMKGDNDINKTTVNANLDKLSIINMPNGGISIEKFYTTLVSEPNEIKRLKLFEFINTRLIELLKNGITPLNKLNYNHCDIKSDNILLGRDNNVRLIDWGLSYENDGKTIPELIKNNLIHFNIPFSILFFNDGIKDLIQSVFLKIKMSTSKLNINIAQAEIMKIISMYIINELMGSHNTSHYEMIINEIMNNVYRLFNLTSSHNQIIDYSIISNSVVVEYIQAVLLKYVDETGIFKDTKYYYEVFTKNADLWGFVLTYLPLIENGNDVLLPKDVALGIGRIILKYCYSSEFAAKPIDVNVLITELLSLNKIIEFKSSIRMRRVYKKKTLKIPVLNKSIRSYSNNSAIKLEADASADPVLSTSTISLKLNKSARAHSQKI